MTILFSAILFLVSPQIFAGDSCKEIMDFKPMSACSYWPWNSELERADNAGVTFNTKARKFCEGKSLDYTSRSFEWDGNCYHATVQCIGNPVKCH